MPSQKTFAQIFKKNRKKHQLSYRQLAQKLGVTAGILLQYEKGNNYPSIDVLERICEVFSLDLKSTYMRIQVEKAPKKAKDYFGFSEPRHPLLRKVLLNRYSEEFGPEYLSSKDAQKEFLLYPFFSIEAKAIEEIYNFLVRAERATPNMNPTEYFNTLSESEVKKKLQESLLAWAFSSHLDMMIFKFNNMIGGNLKLISKKFGLGWYTYYPKYPIIRETLLKIYSASLEFQSHKWRHPPIEKMNERFICETNVHSYHPIEQKILMETYRQFDYHNTAKEEDFEEFFTRLSDKEKESVIQRTIWHWTYDPKQNILIIIFKGDRNQYYLKRFRLWQEILSENA